MNFCSVFQETLDNTNMEVCIKNGFRKCGLFPLDPDNVDYTKCVKNTLEKQNQPKNKINAISTTELSAKDFRSAEKVIKAIEDRLYQYGINVQVINDEIKYFEDNFKIVEDVEKSNEISIVEDVEGKSNKTNTVQDVEEKLNEIEVVEEEESNEINTAKDVEEKSNEINIIEDVEETLNEINIVEDVGEKSNKIDLLVKVGAIVSLDDVNVLPVVFVEQTKSDYILPTGIPPTHYTTETTALKTKKETDNKNDGLVEESSTATSPFSRHLVYPTPNKQTESSRKKEKLPSAISSKEWRIYFQKKDEEKQRKIDNVRKRKELRELNQSLQTKKRKKLTRDNKKEEEKKENTEEKIKCSLCEDDLYSDAEEDSEKNIGCDSCPRWYHLRCTEFGEYAYTEVCTKDYICDLCK